jgi:hypothetical protein
MSIEEKKLLVIQEVISNNNEAFIDQILEVLSSNAADEREAHNYKIPLRVLEDMAERAEADLAAGNLITTAELLADLENW